MAWDTAGDIINDAATEVGLTPVADPYTSTDALYVQLCRLLKIVGREMAGSHDWSQLRMEHSFLTAAGLDEYELPDDFDRMIPQTGWNRTSDEPLRGPLTPQLWAYRKAESGFAGLEMEFRKANGTIQLNPGSVVEGNQEVAFEYQSTNWVAVTGSTEPTKSAPTSATDVVLLDSTLMSRALKAAFLAAKGLDTAKADQGLRRTENRVASAEKPAPILFVGGVRGGAHVIDDDNAPDTGYGS